ncbi:hypothetical protein HF1_05010 [Mycoplasma haemofelis str. Langford 1]|uniref:Uncharacterized protein n=2 Tax=Mycoplasma haemofelis TaxID=29501 RepID=F6FHX2_MYCHI|nr:hypothetical protein [Mycoplasma haemofelis]AEG72820.1 hypothetical protein MHF_0548 [Mycoplasma haemofelis Ohio2]CBY92509.1 hypothetical protein HF1_05010 [Mycoplasma haemofelis str. Langford 1]
MTFESKALFSLLGATAASAGGYGIYKALPSSTEETVASQLKVSLLRFSGEEDKSIWEARALSLGSETQDSVPSDLWGIKRSNVDWKEVRSWCISKLKSPWEGLDSKVEFGVKKYCTYQVKDKLQGAIEISGDWTTISNSLKDKESDAGLSDEMKKIRLALKGEQSSAADTNALKNWCSGVYSKMYQDDRDFKDASTYCVSTS